MQHSIEVSGQPTAEAGDRTQGSAEPGPACCNSRSNLSTLSVQPPSFIAYPAQPVKTTPMPGMGADGLLVVHNQVHRRALPAPCSSWSRHRGRTCADGSRPRNLSPSSRHCFSGALGPCALQEVERRSTMAMPMGRVDGAKLEALAVPLPRFGPDRADNTLNTGLRVVFDDRTDIQYWPGRSVSRLRAKAIPLTP